MNQTVPTTALPGVLAAKLRVFGRKRLWVVALRGVAESVVVFCVGVLVLGSLEAFFKPAHAGRVALSSLLYAAAGLCLITRAVLPLLRRRPLKEVAWDFEQAAGNHFQERIVSAVELAAAPPGD